MVSLPANGAVGAIQTEDAMSPSANHNSAMNRVLFLMALSVLINYIDRSNLSIAAPLIKDELGISGTQLGTLLSAFFYTYGLLQIPAGWLVDRFDVKWVFALGFFVWSASTAVTGLLHGFAALLIARVVLGVGESIAFPSYGKIIGSHFQERQRGFANSIVMTGLALGPALGMWIGATSLDVLDGGHSSSLSERSGCSGWCHGGYGCPAPRVRRNPLMAWEYQAFSRYCASAPRGARAFACSVSTTPRTCS